MTGPAITGMSEIERLCLRKLLPASSPAYNSMYQRLAALQLVGYGPWGECDLLFGDEGATAELHAAHAPVFAYGVIHFAHTRTVFTVHEEDEGIVEARIDPRIPALRNGVRETSWWCYSYWMPGKPGPASGERVREISVEPHSPMTLAICPAERRVWLHDADTAFNRLIPATALYDRLVRHLSIRDPEWVLQAQRLFSHHAEFSDIDLLHALRRYGDERGYFRITVPADNPTTKRSRWRSLLNKITRNE